MHRSLGLRSQASKHFGFKQPYPLRVCETGASCSKHRAVRASSIEQVSPSIEHVRDAHETQTDCRSIRTNPFRSLHSCSPSASTCHGQRRPTAVRMSRAHPSEPRPAPLAMGVLYRSVGLPVRHHCSHSRYERAYETHCRTATNTPEAPGFCFMYWWFRGCEASRCMSI